MEIDDWIGWLIGSVALLAIFIGGYANPTICGSGDCTKSFHFHLIFGGLSVIFLLVTIISLMMRRENEISQK